MGWRLSAGPRPGSPEPRERYCAPRTAGPATATKDQIKDAYEAVQKDRTAVSGDLGDLKGAKKDAVSGAADGLKKAYEGLPGDTTGKDAPTTLRPQIRKLNETAAAASVSIAC